MWQDRSKRFGNWLAYPIQSQLFYQLFLFCMIRRPACMTSACYWKFHNVQQNKYQAKASGKALRRSLEKNGDINDYKNVLMKEYQELNAIEKEDQPQKGGYYMLHHAVIREAASTPKSGLFLTHPQQKVKVVPEWRAWRRAIRLTKLTGIAANISSLSMCNSGRHSKSFLRPEDCQFLRLVWIN